jgi:hypothetical protein
MTAIPGEEGKSPPPLAHAWLRPWMTMVITYPDNQYEIYLFNSDSELETRPL